MADRFGFFNKSSDNGEKSMGNEDFDEEDIWGFGRERKDTNLKVRKAKDTSSINIPDWSKIYRKNSKIGSWIEDEDITVKNEDQEEEDEVNEKEKEKEEEEDDDDEDEDYKIPPHEWIAKKLARNQISSFSVCEGIGRTLKGRDLSKVRNAVLTRTGFLE